MARKSSSNLSSPGRTSSVLKGCLLWGSRIVVPETSRKAVLTELHVGHPGISKIKGLSRTNVWWPSPRH